MTTTRTSLARNHLNVINNAPEAMRPRLRQMAAACAMRKYEETDNLAYYLDAEDFYNND